MNTASRCSTSLSRSLSGLTSAIRSYSASSVPNSRMSLAAVFSPTPGHARDVVGRVALERLVVDHLAGDEVEPLGDPGRVVQDRVLDARTRGHEPGVVGDELEHVEVAGHDRRLQAAPLGVDRDRADDVVGLVARQLVDGDAQRLDHLADLGELVAQVVGHALAGRLVLGVLLVAEGRTLEVEGDRDVVRADVGDAAQDDAAEAEDRVDELALRRRQGRQREISAVDEPVAVEQHQAFRGHGPSVAADRGRAARLDPRTPPARIRSPAAQISARRGARPSAAGTARDPPAAGRRTG